MESCKFWEITLNEMHLDCLSKPKSLLAGIVPRLITTISYDDLRILNGDQDVDIDG